MRTFSILGAVFFYIAPCSVTTTSVLTVTAVCRMYIHIRHALVSWWPTWHTAFYQTGSGYWYCHSCGWYVLL